MTDYSELKRLAEGMKGWDKMTECWPSDENGPDWQVGRLDEDDNRWPFLTIDTEQYDQEQEAPKIAQYYAAANPAAVLALIAENKALQKSYAEAWEKARALQSECDEFARDAERYRWLRAQHWESSAICCVVDPKLCTKLGSYCPSLELLDQAVDAGLKLSKESPNG